MNARRPQLRANAAPENARRLTDEPVTRVRVYSYRIERHSGPAITVTTLKQHSLLELATKDQIIERHNGERVLLIAAEIIGVTETVREATLEPIH